MIDSTNPRVIADNIRHLTAGEQDNTLAITALQTYDDEETNTGKKWIDGSEIFRKVIYIESMPNATTATIAHGISNLGVMISIEGVVQYHSGFTGRPIPYGTSVTVRYGSVNVELQAQGDMSGESCYIILEYTKSAPAALNSPAPDETRSIEPEEIPEDEYIEPEVRDPEALSDEIEQIPEPEVQEVKKTTRKKTTN